MRVGIDLDNVVYDFTGSFQQFAGLPIQPARNWEFYEDQGLTLEQFLKLFANGVDAGFIFRHGEPIEGSVEALQKLKADGHTIHLVTDRFVGTESHINTVLWLADHPEIAYDTLTFSKDKTIVNCRTFIDDKPANVRALRSTGYCHAYLLDTGREDQVGQPHLISGWDEFLEKVAALRERLGGWGEER